jgi:hypothetical protein
MKDKISPATTAFDLMWCAAHELLSCFVVRSQFIESEREKSEVATTQHQDHLCCKQK